MTAFIEEYRGRFGVEPICSTLGVSASAYYHRACGERSARAVDDERLLARIRELHAANYFAYGSRRMWKALLRAGEQVGRSRVERLMRRHGLQGAKRRGKPWRTTTPDHSAVRHPDLVNRDFTAPGPDRLWLADFTYLRCHEGVVFFSFVIDAFSRRIVGWQLATNMRTTLVLDELRMALHQRDGGADVELVHHSDRGSQALGPRDANALARSVRGRGQSHGRVVLACRNLPPNRSGRHVKLFPRVDERGRSAPGRRSQTAGALASGPEESRRRVSRPMK